MHKKMNLFQLFFLMNLEKQSMPKIQKTVKISKKRVMSCVMQKINK